MTEIIKDPICEIETGPFLKGVSTLTFEQVGIYSILLFTMHDKGGQLTYEEMKNVIKREVDEVIMKKFTIDNETGKYYQAKLRDSMVKRVNEREKYVNMGKKRWQKPTTRQNPDDIPADGKQPRQIFVPPTLEEVKKEVEERKSSVDAVKFWHFYDAKGWMVGKNRMKNWKSALVTWERDEKGIERGQHPGQNFVSGKIPAKFKT